MRADPDLPPSLPPTLPLSLPPPPSLLRTDLNRQAGNFFFFLLVAFTLTLVMSMFFRSVGALSRSLSQALVPAALLILALVLYTGFAIPTRYMLGWISWIRYLNPYVLSPSLHELVLVLRADAFLVSLALAGSSTASRASWSTSSGASSTSARRPSRASSVPSPQTRRAGRLTPARASQVRPGLPRRCFAQRRLLRRRFHPGQCVHAPPRARRRVAVLTIVLDSSFRQRRRVHRPDLPVLSLAQVAVRPFSP